MTDATQTSNDGSRHAWACRVFGISPGASPQEVHAAILTHLESAEFMPSPAWRQAIGQLCDPQSLHLKSGTDCDAYHEAMENNLAEEVERFATEFFTLPHGPRRLRWSQLLKRSAGFPRLQARMTSLQPGLDSELSMPDGQNEQDKILVERIRRLFVLKPAAQEAQRRKWLETMSGDWQAAARRVKTKFPKLAQLEPDFLSGLLVPGRESAIAMPIAPFSSSTNLAAAFIKSPSAPHATVPLRKSRSSGSRSSPGLGRYAWVVLFAAGIIGRFLNANSTPDTSRTWSSKPNSPNLNSSNEIDELVSRLRNPVGSAGQIPYYSPRRDTLNPVDPYPLPQRNDMDDANAAIATKQPISPSRSKDSSALSPLISSRTPAAANAWEQAIKRLNASSLPTPPTVPSSPVLSGPAPHLTSPRGSAQ